MKYIFSIDVLNRYALDRNCECLSKVYINGRYKYKWRCKSCGNIWLKSWLTIYHVDSMCHKCYNEDRCNEFLQKAKDVAMSRGFECLSKKYVNNHTKLKFRCKCGCIWNASYNSITNMESGCPRCGYKRGADATRYCLDDCINTAAERLGFCDSTEYVDCKTKMHWRCFLGHKWDAIYDSILNCNNGIGSWCPYCNISSIGETITRKFFEIGFGENFPRCRPVWLKNKKGNRLELDGHNEKLKVAFEFNGRQHKKENNLFHKYRSLDDCISDDRDKIRMCKKRGVSLIVLDYDIRFENIAKYIYDDCVKFGLNIDKKILDLDYRVFDIYNNSLDEERHIVESSGGILLSDRYIRSDIKLSVLCGKGHIFGISRDKLKEGCWCSNQYCIQERKRKNRMNF